MERYPTISDHGLIGDLQTAALVSTDGTVDFFCCPRFDSASVFASLLGADRGGYFKVSPERDGSVTRQLYFPDTAMLITRFMTPDGVGEIVDFMPVIRGGPTDRHRLVRQARMARGSMKFRLELEPAFDYGRAEHTVEVTENGALFGSDGMELTLHTSGRRPQSEGGAKVEQVGRGLRGTFSLREGQTVGVVLESMGGQPRAVPPEEVELLAADTAAFWKGWLGRSTYAGRWREVVSRSAMTLKLLTYAPTGAPVAAATFGLPEQVGGERNWDYRFTWVRDGSLSVHALAGLGYLDEAAGFGKWLRDRVTESTITGDSDPIKIMYRVDGSSDLSEQTMDHFDGWRGSRPVRIGNDAVGQLQLDIYGEALDAIRTGDRYGLPMAHAGWLELTRIIDWLADHWDQPDEGIWETRGGREDFTYGRSQCWVALDSAIRLAERHGRPANLAKWAAARDQLYRQIMERGWKTRAQAFTQHYGTDVLDSSVLLMPLSGFITATDPMWLSTLDAIDRELVPDSLVYRYNPGTEAVLTFEKMQTYANHLGLYSEEISSTGDQLGNFPQAFTHLSLINAALTRNRELDQRASRPGPDTLTAH
jgi:GH15 family glucan-1,4-alpha-glucosidase